MGIASAHDSAAVIIKDFLVLTHADRPESCHAGSSAAGFWAEVQTTPALRQSAMQLRLGMDVGTGLNLNNWQYGSEAPSVSMVLEAMDCHVSDPGCQPAGAKAQERLLEKSAKVICHTRFATLKYFARRSVAWLVAWTASRGLRVQQSLCFRWCLRRALRHCDQDFCTLNNTCWYLLAHTGLTVDFAFAGRNVPKGTAHFCHDPTGDCLCTSCLCFRG